jgi:antitoxin component YwqK of YwqJK toxin-antitoxin module
MRYILSILSVLLFGSSYSQKDTMKTIYKNLPVKKFYSVNTMTIMNNGALTYMAEGKTIDKATYEKYESSVSNFKNCKPCIMETYDAKEVLMNRAIKYLDCPVGYWINYYPSGKIKTIGHYRENESDIWDPLWDAGYCMKHGTWTEYDEKGKVTKFEIYNFGNLKENKKK